MASDNIAPDKIAHHSRKPRKILPFCMLITPVEWRLPRVYESSPAMSINASCNNGCAPRRGIALTPTFHERSVALRRKKPPSIATFAVFFSPLRARYTNRSRPARHGGSQVKVKSKRSLCQFCPGFSLDLQLPGWLGNSRRNRNESRCRPRRKRRFASDSLHRGAIRRLPIQTALPRIHF